MSQFLINIFIVFLFVSYVSHCQSPWKYPHLSWNKEFTSVSYAGLNPKSLFQDWMQFNNRSYPTLEEESYRFNIWSTKMDDIIHINDQDLGFRLRMNEWGDQTWDEITLQLFGPTGSCLGPYNTTKTNHVDTPDIYRFSAPASVDWEAAGDVTPVKNQGSCGSCWAFASTGAMECDSAIQKGKLISLSEQQLVDCTMWYPVNGNHGCAGGLPEYAFQYVEHVGGLCTEKEYPYTSDNGQIGVCKDGVLPETDGNCGTKYDPISKYNAVKPKDESAMISAVASGCQAVGVEASYYFINYSSGVFTGQCGTGLNHGVTVVGYGTDTSAKMNYWKVKNSWGSSWGEDGYIRLCKDCNKNGNAGQCGVLMAPFNVV
eukprot:937869_1